MAKTSKSEKAVKPNVFMRIGLFIKQIIDELRKVVTPTSQGTVLLVSGRIHLRAAPDGPRDRHGLRSRQGHAVGVRLIRTT